MKLTHLKKNPLAQAACHAVCVALLMLPIAVLASTPINETRAVDTDARIDVSNVKGSVTVSAWDKPEVVITGSLGEGSKGLTVDGDHGHLRIKVESPDSRGWFNWGSDSRMGDTTLDVKVPRSIELKIEVVSADVGVTGLDGRLLDIESVSGKLRIDTQVKELQIDSVSGSAEVTGSAQNARIETVSGDIRARGLGGRLKFETVSGDIGVEAGTYSELSAGTVSGSIDLRGNPQSGATITIDSMSGDAHLSLPADASARVHAETFSGQIRSDFGKVESEGYGPGRSLDVNIGNKDGRVSLETFSGDIEIRRQP